MMDTFELHAPEMAAAYLDAFEPETRRRGEDYFRRGRVGEISCAEPGVRFVAPVQGSMLYQVELFYDDADEGWFGDCTCPMEYDCKHAYAAMKALLAEQSVARVREISAGAVAKSAPATRQKKESIAIIPLADQVVAALGRPLNREEAKFLRQFKTVYDQCCRQRRITRWDFQQLGLPLGGYGWEALKIWPAFPQSEHEFWLYVANEAMQHHVPLPDFLAPVTNVAAIQDRLANWRRAEEIGRWNHLLGNLRDWHDNAPAIARGECDLRIKVGEKEAILEWKRPDHEDFETIKNTQLHQLDRDHRQGRVLLPAEAELIWRSFQPRLHYNRTVRLPFVDPEMLALLAGFFRVRALESRLVNAAGQPFARPPEPLRWNLKSAAAEDGNYILRVTQADGTPVPPLLCTLPGNPPLYLTRDALFTGPAVPEHVLEPASENHIPAPALESRPGLELLQRLGVELPPRVRERVRRVPVNVAIRCELKPIYPGSQSENCLFHVLAQSEDGQVEETWTGSSWGGTLRASPPKNKSKREEFIALYDRALMHAVPRLFEPLGLKSDAYSRLPALRVTKKFPELFVPWLKSLPPQIIVRLDGELASLAQDAVSGQVRLDVTETQMDWFDLRVVLDVSDTTLTPAELKLLLDAKGGFVRLGAKGWRRLQFNLTDEEDERLARLGLNPHELTSEPQRLHALQLADEAAKKFLPEQQAAQIQRRASEIKARVTPELPGGVSATLRPYQLEGFHFLAYLAANRFGGILADDMGLGKTLQTLTWLAWLRSQTPQTPDARRHPPSLVVCPKSVMDNWRAEIVRFTPDLRVRIWSASELPSLLKKLGEADLHVINYSQLRLVGEALAPVSWLAVILDEGQYIKNPNSQTAQVARALRADYRLALSGTPIENKLLDLWSLMAFAMPGVLGSRAQFAKMFDAKEDPFARRRLSARVRPFLLRRTKAQVAKDLPDRIEEDLFCEIEGEQKALYRAELKRAQQMLLKIKTQKQLAKDRFHFLTSLLRLRQICCHPALVKPESKAASAKLEALVEQLEPLMEEGNKVLVFSQFVEMLALLQTALAERGWPLFYLAGDTENRGELVQKFQSAEGAAVFLISLKAGGFGLNLTAASYVVLFDPWWNPAVENQAIDRTHRIGQSRNVIAYRLLIKDSIEEKIRALQKQKSALADDVLGEEKFSQSLTLEDLQFLFAD
ncbi:MAG: DEAD/DEAH box helicase [Verrucomicrobia bacterium]|nr:DEAD/DEAH box helicase [Verrucomicrobiota bacterium]